jgi:multidrug efflux pump
LESTVISRFFIDRPIFATVLSVVITLIGGITLMFLPVAQYPRITPPGVSVAITYPGASAQVLADTVAAPIEQQVNGVENMLYMSSQMGNDGTYTLTVTFDIGVDLKTALVMVQNRVALAMPLLPIEVQNQGITIRKKTPDILMIVNFYSPNNRYDDIYLSNYATIYVRDELLRVYGVSDITYQGERDYSIRCWLDPQKLAACNITANDVSNAVLSQSVDAPAGQLGQPPIGTSQSMQLPINTLGRLQTEEQFGNIIIKVSQNPATPAPTSGSGSSGGGASGNITSGGANGGGISTGGGTTTGGGMSGGGGNSSGGGTTGGGATPSTSANSLSSTSNSTTPPTNNPSGAASSSSMSTTPPSTSATVTTPTTPTTPAPSTTSSTSTTIPSIGDTSGALSTQPRGPGQPSTAIVRMRDVARVELGALNYTQACTFDGHPSVGLSVYQLPGTNALDVADAVRAKMEELKERFPDDVEYAIGYDTTPFIRESVFDVFYTLLEAVVLVGIVVLFFLQDWRAMILPLIDVPVSIIGTFAVMGVLGFSLNNISLFGLVLAIGIVVDDAIVVLENIERMMARGHDPRTATIKAMDEVTGPIVAVGLVLCAVFVPCAFISGITGQFFHQFAVTIAVSTVISAINAITMTPSRAVMIFKADHEKGRSHHHREALPWWIFGVLGGILTAWLGRKYLLDDHVFNWLGQQYLHAGHAQQLAAFLGESTKHPPRWLLWFLTGSYFVPGCAIGLAVGWLIIRPVNFVLGLIFRAFNLGFDWMTAGYGWMVGMAMRLSVVMLVIYGGLLFMTYYTFKKAPTGFIPQQDQGRLIVSIQLPDGASLQRTMAATAEVDRILRDTPGVSHTVAFAGMSFLLQANSSNFASMFVVLDPFDERQSPDLVDTAIMKKLRQRWNKEIKDAVVTVNGSSPIPGLGVAGGFKIMVEDRGGLGLEALQQQTDAVVRGIREKPGMNNVLTQFRSKIPQYYLDIDRTKVASLGVSLNDVNQTLDVYLGSTSPGWYNEFGRSWQVTLQAEGPYRADIKGINLFYVRNNQGQMVPLSTLVTPREVGGPISITRYNLYQSASITGNIQGVSTGEAIKEIDQIAGDTLPLSMKTEWTEVMFMQIRAGNTAFYVFLLSILTVFLALSALYESWALPLAVILVVPLCLLCSVVGVLITKRDVNIFVQIGLVVLVGLACKNAILVVEYAKQLHLEGRSVFDATKEASKLRLRPILMTSFAFIFGVVPLVIASGAGAEMRRSLGTAVFSGMLGVTVFGIFLTPVFFYVIQRLGDSQLFQSDAIRWVGSCLVAAGLGMGTGYLFGKLGVVSLRWGAPVGGILAVLVMLAILEVHRRLSWGASDHVFGHPRPLPRSKDNGGGH